MFNLVEIPVIEFVRPNRQQTERMVAVTEEQAAFLQENNIKLSIKDLGKGNYALYVDTGKKRKDGDSEIIWIMPIMITVNTAIGEMIDKIKAEMGI